MLACLLALGHALVQRAIAPAFERLEASESDSNRARVEGALRRELSQLSGVTGDWAPWDDAYHFVQGIDREQFAAHNLNTESLLVFDADVALFVDQAHALNWGALIDVDAESVTKIQDIPFPENIRSQVFEFESSSAVTEGFVSSDFGPMMISARPIIASTRTGRAAGTFILGKLMNGSRAARLRRQTAVDFDFLASGSGDNQFRETVEPKASFRTETVPIADLAGVPLVTLEIRTPRDITALGRQTLDSTLWLLAGLALATLIVLWLALRILVVTPLRSVTEQVADVRKTNDLDKRLRMGRNDEIGILADSFDEFLERLKSARTMRLEQSYRAGMAELAAGMLHNIRNSLTPLVNALDAGHRATDDIVDPHFDRVIDELRSGACVPARRTKLLDYLALTGAQAGSICTTIRSDLQLGIGQTKQIESILANQEQFTSAKPHIESINVKDIVREASTVICHRNEPIVSVGIESGASEFCVLAHRVGLMQILSNVLLNAYESIRRSGVADGKISVNAAASEDEAIGLVRISVCDNGTGIAADRLREVFVRGVTAKQGGHGGLGLHWCANALDDMGGRIYAQSDGVGRGAVFSILLPHDP